MNLPPPSKIGLELPQFFLLFPRRKNISKTNRDVPNGLWVISMGYFHLAIQIGRYCHSDT